MLLYQFFAYCLFTNYRKIVIFCFKTVKSCGIILLLDEKGEIMANIAKDTHSPISFKMNERFFLYTYKD